jgi:putative membrane protein
MSFLIKLLINGLAVFITAYLTPQVKVDSFFAAIVVSVVLGILNTFLKPILILFTLPINFITLGLFTLIINTVIVLFVSTIVPGFRVQGFAAAFIFGLVLSLINLFFRSLT